MNPLEAIEKVGEDIAHVIEAPFVYAAKIEKVLATGVKDEPELKAGIVQLVKLGEKVVGDGAVEVADKGLDVPGYVQAFNDIHAVFDYLKNTFFPLVAQVYGEIKTDIQSPSDTAATGDAESSPQETEPSQPSSEVQTGPGLHKVAAA